MIKKYQDTGRTDHHIIGATDPPLAAEGVKVCHLSLNRTSNGLPPYIYCENLAAGGRWNQRDKSEQQIDQRTNRGGGFICLGELHDTCAFRPCTVKQNLSLINNTGSLEELHQILVSSRPRQLLQKHGRD